MDSQVPDVFRHPFPSNLINKGDVFAKQYYFELVEIRGS